VKAALWFVYEFRGNRWNCMRGRISVLLVDDHALVRRGFRARFFEMRNGATAVIGFEN
jgi:hypothetical protein